MKPQAREEDRRKPPSRSVRITVVVDLLANIAGVLVLILGLATVGGITGFRLLEGWALVGVIALLVFATIIAVAAVIGRWVHIRARLGKDKSMDATVK